MWTDLKAGKGQGLTVLLRCHWWTRGTKMPVPAAGKQTDISHSSGETVGGIYCNAWSFFKPTTGKPESFICWWLFSRFVLCTLSNYRLNNWRHLQLLFFGESTVSLESLYRQLVRFTDHDLSSRWVEVWWLNRWQVHLSSNASWVLYAELSYGG